MDVGRLDEAADLLTVALSEAREQQLVYEEFLALTARVELAERTGGANEEELLGAQRRQQLHGVP
jgi:hypothetical protein